MLMLAFPVYGKPFLLLRAALISHGDLAIWHQEPEKELHRLQVRLLKASAPPLLERRGLTR